MVKINHLLIAAIIPIALIVLVGTASAKPIPVTVTVDTIQTNGYYLGVPTLVSGETYQYGFVYTFVPDGSYTVLGTITNNDLDSAYDVTVDISNTGSHALMGESIVTVPAASTDSNGNFKHSNAMYSITVTANSVNDIFVGYGSFSGNVELWEAAADTSGTSYINEGDTITHTVNEGPMSDMNIIFANGKFDFKGSPLYTFAE